MYLVSQGLEIFCTEKLCTLRRTQHYRLDNNNENEKDLAKESSNKDITNNSSLFSSSSSSLLNKSNIVEQRIESNSFLKEAISAARRSASPAASSPLSPTATKKSRDAIQHVIQRLPNCS